MQFIKDRCRVIYPKLPNYIRHYLSASLKVDFLLEVQLLLLTFSTGIQDAVSYPDFKCFASNQTGNSVVLAVGLAGHDSSVFNLANVGLSLGMFLAGAIMTGQLANFVGPRGLWHQSLVNGFVSIAGLCVRGPSSLNATLSNSGDYNSYGDSSVG
ncbi:hypothetical protein FPSE_06948 [Fusarium pseudograminearum CS3096]|uniref:Uncharacterized protein n=1 Tax=Fusarium pseudograminearum (strain CS3096) TaxID=1028729 RepID=K3VFG4_FUSPC|nr:hypothetical protein FPSE_06948 [Fusarium pseudograminearum CS3096]EKJ72902.1 hypothetical protein FPSE_06948 [Fusarium pseudograminearum CS3096]